MLYESCMSEQGVWNESEVTRSSYIPLFTLSEAFFYRGNTSLPHPLPHPPTAFLNTSQHTCFHHILQGFHNRLYPPRKIDKIRYAQALSCITWTQEHLTRETFVPDFFGVVFIFVKSYVTGLPSWTHF